MTEACRCVVLVSGSGTNLQALLDRSADGSLGAEVAGVVSNRPDAYALERARAAGVPAHVVDHTAFADRGAFDAALEEAVARLEPDLVVLAGFMRVLTPDFVARLEGRLINVHPSLLPVFRGLHTHRKALEAGCQVHGTTIHFVTEDLDAGPIIAQAALRVHSTDSESSLRERVQALEHRLLPQVVRWFATGRLQTRDNRVTVSAHAEPDGELIAPAPDDGN
ncbi:MAG TPA: phosphoribosylglycinamide formyltransferase [Gammaproteobacteria bacterium]|nr:phosphoribosylglycinamide formyltransferase [Gammaproteobacteria bacterium]